MLAPELGTGTTQGEHTDMARHTKMKLAALATSFVAALGIVAIAPATSANAGGTHTVTNARSVDGCC
jgi:hypothetical protein